MDLRVLQKRLRDFATERNWTKFHTPKNLSTALVVEAAELAELFQWKTPEESNSARMEPEFRARIGEEVADVLLYLLQIADHTGLDLNHAVEDKLVKNAAKYPVPAVVLPEAEETLKPPQTHVLVDWENVQPKDVDIRALVPDLTHVWIFHGPGQKKVATNQQSFGDALTLVPISRSGKNSLDFHLSYYVGYISSRNPSAKFVVIANDQGYGPMLEHAKELGFVVSQVDFGAQSNAPKKTVAKKTVAKKAAAKKVAAKVPQSSQKAVATNVVSKVKAPAKKKVAASKKEGTSAGKSVQTPKVKKTASAGVLKPSKVKAAAPAKVSKEKLGDGSKNLPAVKDEKAYAHVLASLKKSKNKPTRKVRLYGAVKSLLGLENPDDPAVERAVQRLMREGHLVIDVLGAVTKTP